MKVVEFLKKAYCLLSLFVWAVGAIGGAGYAGYQHQWFVMICVLLLGAEASPFMVSRFKELLK